MEILALIAVLFFLFVVFFQPSKENTEVVIGNTGSIDQRKPFIGNNEELLSTTAIGREINIAQKEIIQIFIQKGLIERISNKLRVTSLGKQFGGAYRTRGNDSWVVWPKSIVKQSLLQSIVLNKPRSANVHPRAKINSRLENRISHFGIYHPYHGGNNPQFNNLSKHILDLKSDRNNGIDYFFNQLKNVNFDNTEAIVIVPSHSPQNMSSTVKRLAQRLAKYKGWIDATDSVVRTRKIDKLAQGGRRTIDVHINSLIIKNKNLLTNKNVLVLDDVTTSGNSLLATMQLLRESNVKSVWSYAVAKTA